MSESRMLEPFKTTIDCWLEEDTEGLRKRHFTATRISARLKDGCGYTGSDLTVWRYVKLRK